MSPLTAAMGTETMPAFSPDGTQVAFVGPNLPDKVTMSVQEVLPEFAVADPERPLEALRTVHSFDPCLACAVHVTDPEGDELVQVKVK